jgi:glycosyltransferase involved in cell wall biosynthesis
MFVYHPPLTVGLAAWIIGLLRGVPFVYNIQDLWPDTLKATGMIGNDRALALIGRVAKFVYSRAAVLLPQSPGFAARLRAVGVPDYKIKVVYNWADETVLAASTPWARPPALHGKFVVTFAGTMGAAQSLDDVLEAASILKTSQPDICFLFIGGGTERARLEEISHARDLGNVLFLPAVPMHEIGAVLQAADALLVHLRDDPLFSITIPSKTQAYLCAGKPILMAVRGDAAALVTHADAGLVVPPQNAAALAGAITQLAAMSAQQRAEMGARGRAFYQRELSLGTGVRHILAALQSAVKSHA